MSRKFPFDSVPQVWQRNNRLKLTIVAILNDYFLE